MNGGGSNSPRANIVWQVDLLEIDAGMAGRRVVSDLTRGVGLRAGSRPGGVPGRLCAPGHVTEIGIRTLGCHADGLWGLVDLAR